MRIDKGGIDKVGIDRNVELLVRVFEDLCKTAIIYIYNIVH